MVAQARGRPDLAGMGTTIVMALLWKDSVLIAHLGDSRAYLYREGSLERLTEDHALAAQLVRWGKITESQAEDNPGRSMLLRYLGADEALQPDFTWLKPDSGCLVLLCTDGLTNMLDDDEIGQVMNQPATLESYCHRLVARANQAGGKDNITVVALRLGKRETRACDTSPSVESKR